MKTIFTVGMILLLGCTKKVGTNPALRYSDDAMLDSCKNEAHLYYNNSKVLLPGKGPHGEHTLRFNSIAFSALTSNGQLPVGALMPEGSLVIKDVYTNGEITLYAFMYKRSGNWLWGEIKPNRDVLHSVTKDPGVCTNCHAGAGNRDKILSFP
ncbi:MAG: hypothetical protein PSX36_07385 [bacterium]|nr:hypothetical protein [bacterium]